MSVRIVCEHCSGELQVPQSSAGKQIRCPLCGNVSTAFAVRAAAPKLTPEAPAPWTPVSEEVLDNPIPWYILLGAVAPAGLLGFVAHEPIAFAVAAVLVMISLFVATRRDWSRWSRFMGVVCLSLLAYGAAAAVNLYAHGSFAQLGSLMPFAGGDHPDRSSSELEHAVWKEFWLSDSNVKVLMPGAVDNDRLGHSSGLDIYIYEAKFPKEDVAFALRTFRIPTPTPNEKAEEANLAKLLDIVVSTFMDVNPNHAKKIYYYDHPGFECSFTVAASKRSEILCRAYLVRDRAYIVSATAEKIESIRPLVNKFLDSFRLVQPVDAMRTTVRNVEPDWKALGRPPILKVKPWASYRAHLKPPVAVIAFALDGKQMVTGSSLEHVVNWQLETGHGVRVGGTDASPFFAVHPGGKDLVVAYPFFAIHPGGKDLVMAFQSGDAPLKIRFLPLDVPVPELGPANTDYIGFSADQKTAFVAIERDLTAWDADEKKLWTRLAANAPLTRIAVSRDGRIIASSAAKEPIISLWNDKGADLKSFAAGHGVVGLALAPIQQLAFSPDGKLLASAGLDTTVKIWNVEDAIRPKLVADLIHIGEQFGVSLSSAEFSNDGKRLATGDFSGVVRIWETKEWKLLHEFRVCDTIDSVQTLRFAPDDTKLAVAVDMGLSRAGVNLYEVKSLPAVAADAPSIGLRLTDEPELFKANDPQDPKGMK